jgi:hypothetical protein
MAVTVASSVYNPVALAVDAKNVYWVDTNDSTGDTTNGAAMKAPISGGNPASPTVISGGHVYPTAIAVNPYGVYWVDGGSNSMYQGGLWWVDNNNGLYQVGTTSQINGVSLASNTTTLYWFDESTTPNPASLLTVAAGSLNTPTSPGTGGGCPIATVLDATTIYWLDTGCFAGSGALYEWSLSLSGTPTRLIPTSPLNGPYSHRIAVDANGVYLFESQSGSILRAPLTPGAPAFLVPSASANGVAVDANNIYWTDGTQNAILYAPLAGGAGTPLVTGQNSPYDIVLDANSIYWTNNANPGSVMKVAKP